MEIVENKIEKKIENLEEVPQSINEENSDAKFKKEDIDATALKVIDTYQNLAECIIERVKSLDTLRPLLEQSIIDDLEVKIKGLSVNLTKLEKDINGITENSALINTITAEQKEETDEEKLIVIDARLISEFESYLYLVGNTYSSLNRLAEYYFTNIQSVIDDLVSKTFALNNRIKNSLDLKTAVEADIKNTEQGE